MTNPFVTRPQDEFLFDRYNTPADTAAPAQQHYRRVGSWLVEDVDTVDPSLLDQQQADLADSVRVQEAEAVLTNDALPSEAKAQQLGAIATEQGQKDGAAATVGLATTLAAQDGVLPPNPVASRQRWLERTNAAQERVRRVVESFGADQDEKAAVRPTGNITADAVLSAANYTRQAVQAYLFPDFSVQLVDIARKYAPDFEASDYVAPKQLYNAVGRSLRNMEPDDAEKAAREIAALIEQKAGTLFENNFEAKEMAQVLLESAYDSKTNWRNVSQALDLIGLIPVAGGAVKLAAKGAFAAENLVSAGVKAVGGVARETTEAAVRRAPSAFDTEVAKLNAKLAELDKALGREAAPVREPTISVGTTSDAATMTPAGARQAVKTLGTETEEAVLATAGTSPEQVAGSLIVPKIATHLDELNRPYVEDIYLRPEVREQVAERVKSGLNDRFQTRLKDTRMEQVENGYNYEAMLGSSDGRGYARREFAEGLAADQFKGVPHEVVEQEGRFFIKVKGFEPYTLADIKADSDLVKAGGFWRQLFGKSAAFTDHFVTTSNAAVRASDKAAGVAHRILEPYSNLWSFSKTKVNKLLEKGEIEGRIFTESEARAIGLSKKEWEGYDAVRRLADRDLSMTNFNVRQKLVADGYKETTIAGKPAIVRAGGDLPASAKVVNLSTGQAINAKALAGQEYRVFRVLDGSADGYTHAVVIGKGKNVAFRELPLSVLQKVEGYLPRRYKYSHYVRELLEDGTTRAVRGGRGSAEAAELLAREQAANPAGKYAIAEASEISDVPAVFDDVQRLKDQGLFYTSHRRPDVVTGLDGKPKLISVEDSVNQMVNRFGVNAGLTRWTDYMMRTLNATYGDLGVHFAMGQKPTLVGGLRFAKDKTRYRQALAIWQHVQRTNGIAATQLDPMIQGVRNGIADFLWSNKLVNKIPGSRVLGDNISGISDSITVGAKSAAFASYLGTNVVRNWFTQSSMIPTYFGVRGGLSYAMKGAFTRDMAVLQMSKMAPALARKLDSKLVDDWIASGMDEAVENHVFTLGTLSEARSAATGVVGDTLGRAVNVLKRVGFDVGVRADKRAAFLVSRNRFLTDNKRLPKNEEEWQRVVSDAENISMNQNRADQLPLTNGILGLMMQFQQHHVKMWGRLTMQESGFTVAEKLRMQGLGLITYGMDGYRVGNLIDQAEAESGEKWHPTVKELVRQGIEGTLFNMTLRAALDEGDERTAIDLSGTISPVNFVGPDLNLLTELMGVTISTYDYQGPGALPAAGGLVGDIKDVVDFGLLVAGKTDLPAQDKAQAITAEFFRKFPVSSNLLKAYMAFNTGIKPDSMGNPVVRVTKAEAIAAIAGLPTNNENEIAEAMGLLHGEFSDYDDTALINALSTEAKKNAGILASAINDLADGGRTLTEVRELVYNHAVAMKSSLGDTEVRTYYNALINEIEKRGVLKSDRVVASIISNAAAGRIRVNGDLLTTLDTLNLPGIENAKKFIRDQQDTATYMQRYLQEQ